MEAGGAKDPFKGNVLSNAVIRLSERPCASKAYLGIESEFGGLGFEERLSEYFEDFVAKLWGVTGFT